MVRARQPLPWFALTLLIAGGVSFVFASSPSPETAPLSSLLDVGKNGTPAEIPPAGCAAGCSAAPGTRSALGRLGIEAALAELAFARRTGASEERAPTAFDTLLFHGDEVRRHLAEHGAPVLTGATRAELAAALRFDRCRFDLRVVDEHGIERVHLDAQVPFGVKQHLHPQGAVDLSPPEFSFTVLKVGERHLWARF